MRQIRNELAHDYQDDPEAGSRSLNDVYQSIDELTAVGESAAAFVRERVVPSLESE